MSSTRRRSTSWMRELINHPLRIDVAPTGIDPNSSKGDFRLLELNGSKMEARNSNINDDDGKSSEQLSSLEDLETSKFPREKSYLERYFLFLHCVGLASFKKYGFETFTLAYGIHKAFFGMIATLAIIDALKLIKLGSILYATQGDMYKYVVIGRHILNCVKRTYFLGAVSAGSKQLITMFDELETSRKSMRYNCSKFGVYACGFASLLASIIRVLFGWVNMKQGWSPTECVLEQSFDMSLSLFVWTKNQTKSEEQYKMLQKSYGQNFTLTTATMGITGMVMESFGDLVDYAVTDVMFFTAVTMYRLAKEFQQAMEHGGSPVQDVLKQYKQLQNVSDSIDAAFSGLFKLSHATNLLLCAYFLVILVSDEEFDVFVILLVLQILKVWVTYYLAIKATKINKSWRGWVRNTLVDNETLEIDIKLKGFSLLEESLETPIGLGSETFFIDEIFALKFATMVGTFSLFLIDTKRKSEAGES